MKTMGLIGGMSWESSLDYYRIVNQEVQKRLGGLHSAKVLLYSFDFQEIEELQHQGRWEDLGRLLAEAALKLEAAGADFLVLCTNTMHKAAGHVQDKTRIPLLHIADTAAEAVKKAGIKKVGLLGTRFTMEEDFYKKRLLDVHGIESLIPEPKGRDRVHQIIYQELCQGILEPLSKNKLVNIIDGLKGAGAEGVILGCTELPLLVKQGDIQVPLFDTTAIHAAAAVHKALE